MTSRERVRRAVLFERPDRIPRALPEPYGSDIQGVGLGPDPDFVPSMKTPRKWENEWGCLWEKTDDDRTMGRIYDHPLASYDRLESFRFPDFLKPERYRRFDNPGEKFVLATIPVSLMQTVEDLRGPEAAWTDPYVNPVELERLLDRLTDMALGVIDRFADLGADGIFLYDDWGHQDRLMLSPDMFRAFWKPRYTRIFRCARERKLLTFMHSCGYIVDILDDLIEVGLNVIQMDQQENMGLANLGKRFGGRLCFWCPVDIQVIMVPGSVAEIRAYARRLINTLGRFDGGFIAKWYPAPDAVGHTREKLDAMCEEFVVYGQKVTFPL